MLRLLSENNDLNLVSNPLGVWDSCLLHFLFPPSILPTCLPCEGKEG